MNKIIPSFLVFIFICINYSALASENEYLCIQFVGYHFKYKTDSDNRAVQDKDGEPVLISENRYVSPHKITFKIVRDRKQPMKVYYTDIHNPTREYIDGDNYYGENIEVKEDDDKIYVETDAISYTNFNEISDFEKGFLKSKEMIFFKKTNQLYEYNGRHHQSRFNGNMSPSEDYSMQYYNCEEL